MKTTNLIFTCVLIFLFSPSGIAQQTGNQLFTVVKHSVKPDKIHEYKELMKKFVSACKDYYYPGSIYACQSATPDFYYFYPVWDYNTAEKLNNETWKIISEMESDYAKKLFETIESRDQFFVRLIDSLSYSPENFLDIREDLVYAEWWVNYYKTGTELKYRNTFERAIEIAKKSGFEYPISRYQCDIGMNGPAIITVFWGKNETDLYNHLGRDWEILGEEVQEMINDLRFTTKKFEKTPFWYQKDLSYYPE